MTIDTTRHGSGESTDPLLVLFDDHSNAEDAQPLLDLIQKDPQLADRVTRLLYLDGLLVERGRIEASRVSERRTLMWRLVPLAAAAALVAVAGLWFWAERPPAGGPMLASVVEQTSQVRGQKPDGSWVDLKVGDAIVEGMRIETASGARLAFAYPGEATRVELAAASAVGCRTSGTGGKALRLEKGLLTAVVARQPPGKPMTMATDNLEAEVVGTRFSLSATSDRSRLVVDEGTMRARHKGSGDSVAVVSGQCVDAPAQPVTRFAGTQRTGVWKASSGADAWGESALSSEGKATFRWIPALDLPGEYLVCVRWPMRLGMSTNATYTVRHAEGGVMAAGNQGTPLSAGCWMRLGTYRFAAGQPGYVELSTEGTPVCADAVLFVRVTDGREFVVDDSDTGTAPAGGLHVRSMAWLSRQDGPTLFRDDFEQGLDHWRFMETRDGKKADPPAPQGAEADRFGNPASTLGANRSRVLMLHCAPGVKEEKTEVEGALKVPIEEAGFTFEYDLLVEKSYPERKQRGIGWIALTLGGSGGLIRAATVPHSSSEVVALFENRKWAHCRVEVTRLPIPSGQMIEAIVFVNGRFLTKQALLVREPPVYFSPISIDDMRVWVDNFTVKRLQPDR